MGDSSPEDALRRLDDVLAAKPKKDDHAFSAALRSLTALRDGLVRSAERSNDRAPALSHLNAIISVVMGGQHPLGQVPWGEIEKSRGWLSDILETRAAHPPAP